MFESPLKGAFPGSNPRQDTEWDYANELATMAEWLCRGAESSAALKSATDSLDTFRGPAMVRRWLHSVATFEIHPGKDRCSHDLYLDAVVEGQRTRPGNRSGLDGELEERMEVLARVAALSDNYRCVLLLKEGLGLTVAQTARLLETSPAAVRSILYRARQLIRS